MQFVNLTSHSINEVTTGTQIPRSGIVARVKQSTEKVNGYAGCPVYTSRVVEVAGIPAPQPDTIYIVSSLVLSAIDYRPDIVSPGNPVKDNGVVIGCIGFRQNNSTL